MSDRQAFAKFRHRGSSGDLHFADRIFAECASAIAMMAGSTP